MARYYNNRSSYGGFRSSGSYYRNWERQSAGCWVNRRNGYVLESLPNSMDWMVDAGFGRYKVGSFRYLADKYNV